MRNVIIVLITMAVLGFMGASDYEAELKTQQINETVYKGNPIDEVIDMDRPDPDHL
jgi:hypothetical protein